MVVYVVAWNRPGYIAKVDETMDSQLYIQILQEDLAQEELIFQHNNDPKHTAKTAKAYLNSVGLTENDGTPLYWPAQSLNLNPIEHMWNYLKIKLGKYPITPTCCEELWKRIAAEWYKIPVKFCRRLIRSMPGRLAAVYYAHGKQTKY